MWPLEVYKAPNTGHKFMIALHLWMNVLTYMMFHVPIVHRVFQHHFVAKTAIKFSCIIPKREDPLESDKPALTEKSQLCTPPQLPDCIITANYMIFIFTYHHAQYQGPRTGAPDCTHYLCRQLRLCFSC